MGVETDESWKGEHLIRGIRPERDERINNGRRAVSGTRSAERRASRPLPPRSTAASSRPSTTRTVGIRER